VTALSVAGVALVAAIAAVAVGVVLGARLFFRQDRLVFRPRSCGPRTPADVGIRYEAVSLTGPPDQETTTAWWIAQPEADWLVIYFHGSAGQLGCELATIAFLVGLNASVLAVEYPGFTVDGTRPSEAGCYRSADRAWDFAVNRIDDDRIILYGHSLGGAVAAYLAAGHRCGGLVLHSTFTSVPDVAARRYPYLPTRPFCRTKMNTLRRIANVSCPVLVLHSSDDTVVPPQHAERLHAAALGPKKLLILRGGHAEDRWRTDPNVVSAWRALLTSRTASWASESG
jgi:fermentation-respiration switch protein FrsA (DUF1100 family)